MGRICILLVSRFQTTVPKIVLFLLMYPKYLTDTNFSTTFAFYKKCPICAFGTIDIIVLFLTTAVHSSYPILSFCRGHK